MNLWNDSRGGVFTTELLLVTSFVVAGVSAGLAHYRDSIQAELTDLAAAVQTLNQSYVFSGVRSPAAKTAGSQFVDRHDGFSSSAAACIQFER